MLVAVLYCGVLSPELAACGHNHGDDGLFIKHGWSEQAVSRSKAR